MNKNMFYWCLACNTKGDVNSDDIKWLEDEKGECPKCGKPLAYAGNLETIGINKIAFKSGVSHG